MLFFTTPTGNELLARPCSKTAKKTSSNTFRYRAQAHTTQPKKTTFAYNKNEQRAKPCFTKTSAHAASCTIQIKISTLDSLRTIILLSATISRVNTKSGKSHQNSKPAHYLRNFNVNNFKLKAIYHESSSPILGLDRKQLQTCFGRPPASTPTKPTNKKRGASPRPVRLPWGRRKNLVWRSPKNIYVFLRIRIMIAGYYCTQ